MTETQTTQTGTVVESPKTGINWITEPELEKFIKLTQRRFVRKNDAKDAKKFYYKIISWHKYEPQGFIGNSMQFVIAANVQKYHRNQKITVKTRPDSSGDVRESSVDAPVASHVATPEGDFRLLDETASFLMDSREFLEKFELDTES